ncbi:RNA polymerase sigma factor [Petralouisia muris]|uniref:RNA polymerase sigma factor n=1 Tax=Petralouisia muris TaxID=3032872 RepID=UPI0023B7BF62|nr:sigma-70 family RNA polymerase sigma factor [Petralouisia muris]
MKRKNVYAFCSQFTQNKQEAEELYQNTFLKAVELKEIMDWEGNPGSYLVSIVLRIWKNRKRKYAWRNRIAGMEELIEEKDDKNLEQLLRRVLSPEEETDYWLNQQIVRKAKETELQLQHGNI